MVANKYKFKPALSVVEICWFVFSHAVCVSDMADPCIVVLLIDLLC